MFLSFISLYLLYHGEGALSSPSYVNYLLNEFRQLRFDKCGILSTALYYNLLGIGVIRSKAGDALRDVVKAVVDFLTGAVSNVNADNSHCFNFLSLLDVLIIAPEVGFVN